jgi:hypothetical protein
MTSIVYAAIGFIVVIGAVAGIEFAGAPAGRKARVAVQAAAVTTCIIGALLGLAAGYEWLASAPELPDLPDLPDLPNLPSLPNAR